MAEIYRFNGYMLEARRRKKRMGCEGWQGLAPTDSCKVPRGTRIFPCLSLRPNQTLDRNPQPDDFRP